MALMRHRNEHLYSDDPRFDEHIILSRTFKNTKLRTLSNVKVILATVSMLSNPHIRKKFTNIVPMRNIIVDEASQIEISAYVPLFTMFPPDRSPIRKVCFIGDDKQCMCFFPLCSSSYSRS